MMQANYTNAKTIKADRALTSHSFYTLSGGI